MIKFAVYAPSTGEITSSGMGQPPFDGSGVSWVEHNIDETLDNYKVDLGTLQVVPKEYMSLTLPGPTPADGVTEAVVSGLPVGTKVYFVDTIGDPQSGQVDDGSLELIMVDPGFVVITFWHPLYWHDPVEVVFT